jgi:hypothetical protein
MEINTNCSNTNNQIHDLDALCSQQRLEAYDPKIIIVPDVLNEQTKSLLSLMFSHVTKNSTDIKRVFLFSDSLLPPNTLSRKVYIPSTTDPILNNINFNNDAFEIVSQLNHVTTNNEINFSEKFAPVLPFLNHLLPNVPTFAFINHSLKKEELFKIINTLDVNKNDLCIFVSCLSVGLSKTEAISYDTSLITRLIAQDTELKIHNTPYASILNLCTMLAYNWRLRARFFEYAPIEHHGRRIIKTRGVCTIAYL